MNKIIAISIGDINGIGIELLLNLYFKKKINNFILFTNSALFLKYLKKKKLILKINIVNTKEQLNYRKDEFNIYTYKSKSNEENTYNSIKLSYKECQLNNLKGLITLPIRKDILIKKIDKNFTGHTELFANLSNKKFTNMILANKKLIIVTLTTHIELKKISKTLSKKNFIYDRIYNLNKTLKIDFNIKKPKILVSGINPHAGENGYIGKEEIKTIKPQLKKLKKNNCNVFGPFSGDTMLTKKNIDYFDCFVFMYHDQALIPFKYISNFSGVNYTGNIDVIRVSPDHGTAYDLVGKGKFSNRSLTNCFRFIKEINNNRNINGYSKKIT